MKVTLTPDAATSASAVITEAGGTLSTTGPDGTVFKLDIPPRALVVPTHITMTPVSAIDGMPFGTGPSAVKLEPEGLMLYEFATLTFTLPTPLGVDQQILFGWSADGSDVVLAPPVATSPDPAIRLWHFSGYGATKGFRADPESVRAKLGGSTESRLQNAIAAYLLAERQHQLLGGPGSDFSGGQMADLLNEYVEKVVKLRIAAIADGCAEAKLAVLTVLEVMRMSQLLGIELKVDLPLPDINSKAGLSCMKEELQLCVDHHIIHRMIPA